MCFLVFSKGTKDVVLVFLLLTLSIFRTFFLVFLQVNVSWESFEAAETYLWTNHLFMNVFTKIVNGFLAINYLSKKDPSYLIKS